jgi:hypothetical protein
MTVESESMQAAIMYDVLKLRAYGTSSLIKIHNIPFNNDYHVTDSDLFGERPRFHNDIIIL